VLTIRSIRSGAHVRQRTGWRQQAQLFAAP